MRPEQGKRISPRSGYFMSRQKKREIERRNIMEYRNFVDTLIENVRDKTGMEKEKVFFQEADGYLKEDAILMIFGEGKIENEK